MESLTFIQLFVHIHGKGTQSPVLNDETSAFIQKLLADNQSPGGAAIAVVRRNSGGKWDVETKGYGVATLTNGNKVTEDTLFSISSNSKMFTIFANGILMANDTITPRFSWNTKLSTVIPGFGMDDPVAQQQATIIDAMSHRTGVPRHDFSFKVTDDVPSIITKVKNHKPSAEFRQLWQYSNNMYILLSYIPTSLLPSKIPFTRYVKQHILDPLGMTSTTYSSVVASASGRLADGMARQVIGTGGAPVIFRSIPYWFPSGEDGNVLSGATGLISSATDMATWLKTLLSRGAHPETNSSVIPADVVQTAATGFSISSGVAAFPELSPVVYAGGQDRGTYRGYERLHHRGSAPGFRSVLMWLPSENIGVAVLTNDEEFGLLFSYSIVYRLIDEALGLEPLDWATRLRPSLTRPTRPTTPRPSNATFPYGNLSSIAGKYFNPGYGPLELCLVSEADPGASESCKALAQNISTILPGTVTPDVPTLFARLDSPWASHFRFIHFDRGVFNVTTFASYSGNSSAPFWPLEYDIGALASAVVDDKLDGFGLSGIWNPGQGVRPPTGNTIRERAEVWFERA